MLITQAQVSRQILRNIRIVDSGTVHIDGSGPQGTRLSLAGDISGNKGFVVGTVMSLVSDEPSYNATMAITFHGTRTTYKVKFTSNLLTGTPPIVKLGDVLTIPVTQLVGT